MFADLDESLKAMLVREVPLPPNEIDVVFERPDRDAVARFSKPTVDLFLFDFSENRDFREAGWRATRNGNGGATLRWPPLRVDLRYLVTVWAQAVDDQHRLLYHLYRALRRLAEIPEAAREGVIEAQTKPLRLEVEEGALKAILDLWGVLDNRMQPGFVLKTTVAVDLNGAREAPLVRTSTLRAGRFGHGSEERHRLGGRVTDTTGQPVAGATVRVGGRRVGVETAADGGFQVRALAPGQSQLIVEAQGYRRYSRDVTPPGDYQITLEPATADQPAPDTPPRSRARRGGGR
jgi:hypothetical protein